MKRRTMLSTTVAAFLGLTVQIRRQNQTYLLTVPLLPLTGFLFTLWAVHQAVTRHWLELGDQVAAAATSLAAAATSLQVTLIIMGIIAGAVFWAMQREVGTCRISR